MVLALLVFFVGMALLAWVIAVGAAFMWLLDWGVFEPIDTLMAFIAGVLLHMLFMLVGAGALALLGCW